MATTSKAAPKRAAKATAKATPPKRTAARKAAAPKSEAKGRQPVTSDADITKWVKAELAKAAKRNESVSTAALLRAWRKKGGKANPRRFAALVADAR
jgi:hypothetical protein